MTLQSNRKKAEKPKSIWELNNTILNNQGVKEKI